MRHTVVVAVLILHACGVAPAVAATPAPDFVVLSDAQLAAIKTGPVGTREFTASVEAVGSIDFDEDRTVQVFSPYPGRILRAFASLGDRVKRGQTLFTVESPDFIAAETALIAASATFVQAHSALTRARDLYAAQGMDQNDFETAVANDQAADGALRAARQAVAVFGLSVPQIDRLVESRRVDNALTVKSPQNGQVTARNAAPGALAQPGTAPAPYAVSDLSTVWLLANVTESDSPAIRVGAEVTATVAALPGRRFRGRVSAIAASVDPNSHRVLVRSEIANPGHELLPQMFATVTVRIRPNERAAAVPLNGVVREGNGSLSVWVVDRDPHRFVRRVVKVGRQQEDFDEILTGVTPGEHIAVDGAIFLSNLLNGGAS